MKKKTERVVVDTPIKVGDAVQNRELPFKVLVIAPISGKRKPTLRAPRPVTTTGSTSLDRLMADTKPVVPIDVENRLGGETLADQAGVPHSVRFNMDIRSMEDFSSAGIERALAENVTAFSEKLAVLRKLTNFQAKLMNSKDLEGLDEDLEDGGLRELLAHVGGDRKGSL